MGQQLTHSRSRINELLEQSGLAPRRDLGQNFVADANTVRRIASLAKYFASRAAKTAVANATEIFGGYALADEYPISMFKGFIEMLNVGEGSTNVQKVLIAEDALGFKDANRASMPARKFRSAPGSRAAE